MLRHKTLKDTVLLIYANKADYENSMTTPEIVEGLDVQRVVRSPPPPANPQPQVGQCYLK